MIDADERLVGESGQIGRCRLPPVGTAAFGQRMTDRHGKQDFLFCKQVIIILVPLGRCERCKPQI